MGDQDNSQNDLIPRKYQEEIFERARNENVIAALDTGSGKTHISSLLIKWIASQDSMSRGKVILFFVPRVPLVEQQAEYLKKHTTLRVCKLSGEVDLADRKGWRRLFSKHDIFVMTAQIFVNLLTHSHWSMKKVSLIIFDECHHARKNHPYKSIMDEYKLLPVAEKPRVFGMTASPIWNPRNSAKSLRDLEENLCSKIIGVLKHTSELERHAPKPIESVLLYPPPPPRHDYNDYSVPPFRDHFSFSDDKELRWNAVDTKLVITHSLLGPYGADQYLFNELTERLRAVDPGRDELDEYALITELIKEFADSFNDALHVPLSWCSPKLHKLVEVLLENDKPDFQGIIFVEQRHIAFHLASLLCRIRELNGKFRPAALIGQDSILGTASTHKTNEKNLHLFKEGRLNLLVATSVAEEGLHFPACDLVIRFDGIQTLTSYIQSRGRARKESSKFIVMVQEGDIETRSRYQSLQEAEPHLRAAYQQRHADSGQAQDEMDEDIHPEDLLNRERYVIHQTQAVITYDNSISLIEYLCSLLPNKDPYLPSIKPSYTVSVSTPGPFSATLRLPPHLPLPREDLKYVGLPKGSRKEAKRAVAFLASKRLHELGVFNDYLLPGISHEDEHGTEEDMSEAKTPELPLTMNVLVKSPWTTGPRRLWLHFVEVDGYVAAGIVTGTWMAPVNLFARGHHVQVTPFRLIDPAEYDMEEEELKALLEAFTRAGIWWLLTGQKIGQRLGLFTVPLTLEGSLDMSIMRQVVESPFGSQDWSHVHDITAVLIMNRYKLGRPCVIRRVHQDLNPLSIPQPGTREEKYATYHDYFTQEFIRNPVKQRPVPTTGPLVEVSKLERNLSAEYQFDHSSSLDSIVCTVPNGFMYPLECCVWMDMPAPVRLVFQLLHPICRRLTDLYRINRVRVELAFPPVHEDLLVEALTTPQSNRAFNNQRLETLGDAVLQLAATVHFYNTYPYKHEGQLTDFRKAAVSNKTLRKLAKAVHLEEFMCSEPIKEKKWKYIDDDLGRRCRRQIPRRSLQDCMEASLGAAYLTGGMPMALITGHALGINTGGPTDWPDRSYPVSLLSQAAPLFRELQISLGYIFCHSNLLVEAVTHASFLNEDSLNYSYERLEFLGDALIELVVTDYLYKKFPAYNSAYLSRARARVVCASVLGFVAVYKLSLHKYILFNNMDLSQDLERWAEIFSNTSPREIIRDGWKYDPPKIISDVLESVLGAVLIDSGWDYDRAAEVTLHVLEDVLEVIGSEVIDHPMALLVEWCAQNGCTRIAVQKLKGDEAKSVGRPAAKAIFHETEIVKPIPAHTRDVAKGLVAEEALLILRDGGRFQELCDCRNRKEVSRVVDEELSESLRNLAHP